MPELTPELLLEAHRRNWIWDLRSGNYTQANGHLFHMRVNWRNEVTNVGHCCIGVWCDRNIPEFRTHTQESNYNDRVAVVENEMDYDKWMEALEIPVKLKQFLMSMNDGSSLFAYTVEGLTKYYVGGPGSREDSNRLRADGADREFPFIARFLERVWGY